VKTPSSDITPDPRNIQNVKRACTFPSRAVANCAERLEDRTVEDVRADRERRLEAEEEHEDGRQQRAAAHSGEANEDPDEEPGEGELPGHGGPASDIAALPGREHQAMQGRREPP
jgi:hypothetical protein